MELIDKIKEIIFKIKDYDRLESDYCTVLDMVTGARLSKPNYKMDSIREAFNEFLDEHDKNKELLTNADVYDIWRIYNEVCAEGEIYGFDEISQEVLKRFKERKEE